MNSADLCAETSLYPAFNINGFNLPYALIALGDLVPGSYVVHQTMSRGEVLTRSRYRLTVTSDQAIDSWFIVDAPALDLAKSVYTASVDGLTIC